jgi:hypothetical protein
MKSRTDDDKYVVKCFLIGVMSAVFAFFSRILVSTFLFHILQFRFGSLGYFIPSRSLKIIYFFFIFL